MDDLIRREDALAVFSDAIDRDGEVLFEASEYSEYKAIEALPSVPQWIPVAERVPKNETGRLYLVTLDDGYCPVTYVAARENNQWVCAPLWNGKKWVSSEDTFLLDDTEVTAWMLLPEPWDGEE